MRTIKWMGMVLGLPVLLFLARSEAASFDCLEAKTVAEKLICQDPELSQADERLDALYQQARAQTKNLHEFKAIARANWTLREQCRSAECLKKWYADSTSLLENLIRPTERLQGVLSLESAPDPSKKDGTEIKFLAIKTLRPVNVYDGEFGPASASVLQLAITSSETYKKVRDSLGSAVSLSCREFLRAYSAHHLTAVVCYEPFDIEIR